MVQKITWTLEALRTFNKTLDYLQEHWTTKEVDNFTERLSQKIDIIKIHPRLGSRSGKHKNVYKTVLHKRVMLIYTYKPLKKEIVLLNFWNTLQNPQRK